MLSNREIKWINSLKNKKYRLKHRAYIAEGPRLINELILNGQTALQILITDDSLVEGKHAAEAVITVSEKELKQVSAMVQPNGMLAVFEIPEARRTSGSIIHPSGKWAFALDFVQDPGNLGTIIRTLSWLGIDHLYCSNNSVDIYNPKVVQASMGGIGRLQPNYVDLPQFLAEQDVPVYAADMSGDAINSKSFAPGIIVLGNEGQGLSDEILKIAKQRISIPKLGGGESLNVAVTTAIMAAWVSLQ